MLFDLGPKDSREDLYDFEMELRSLINGINGDRIIVVKGLRRTGKASLMRVALNEAGHPYIYLDVRPAGRPRQVDLIELIRRGLEDFLTRNKSIIDVIRDALSRIRWISMDTAPIRIKVRLSGGLHGSSIGELLNAIK